MNLLSRKQLKKRWGLSLRTLDRLRDYGHLPWIDLTGGRGSRPIVRFRVTDIEKLEKDCLQKLGEGK